MHRASSCRWLTKALRTGESLPASGVPLFLCPTAGIATRQLRVPSVWPHQGRFEKRRWNHSEAVRTEVELTKPEVRATEADAEAELAQTELQTTQPQDESSTVEPVAGPQRRLPITCSGCGAFSQTSMPDQLGYYDLNVKRVRTWLKPEKRRLQNNATKENQIVNDALKSLSSDQLAALGLDAKKLLIDTDSAPVASVEKPPVCERCHDLIHHHVSAATAKIPMYHPSVESLRETIEESTHKYNHIYHVIDAADFPMSLIPRLNVLLGDVPLRSRNRRNRKEKFLHGRKTEMSFVITRGDLLGPSKEVVDSMMPYLREVLRESLGRLGDKIRLGNMFCVSTHRGWWTTKLKEEIWKRGGAGWMVGKVNVGKSSLFEAVFPKGRLETQKNTDDAIPIDKSLPGDEDLDIGYLLPPLREATNYPEMPLISPLPGTTASPIRIPFGNHKGELIDLPGMARSDLELFVKEEHRQSLIMKKRIVPEQATVKSGKSLVLGGGLIRLTPRSENMVFLMYNFTPLEEHLTSTEKAMELQGQTRNSGLQENICLPETAAEIQHAGTFALKFDVTKHRAGPLTRKDAVGLSVDRLAFRVMSVDIVIEGVGYVEVVAQIRKRRRDAQDGKENLQPRREEVKVAVEEVPLDPFEAMMQQRRDGAADKRRRKAEPRKAEKEADSMTEQEAFLNDDYPLVDVYTPEGRFVAPRRPIQGWLANKPILRAKHKRGRPRKSMKGEKKRAKAEARMSKMEG